jgi:ergothioneine biosynthesis protein EgtB
MQSQATESKSLVEVQDLADLYARVRQRTMDIVAPLEIEDYVVQTGAFMSPPRWHLGHTSWFFEQVLRDHKPGYRVFSEEYLYYFNSYYERFGTRIQRDRRGTRSRPTVRETIAYRKLVDENVLELLSMTSWADRNFVDLIRLGLEHEMQHQELLVYDIKHLLCDLYSPIQRGELPPRREVTGMSEIEGGLFEIGFSGKDFAFDNEKPAHKVYVQDFAIDRGPVTNGEYLAFMNDGGYSDYRWWHSDGWYAVAAEGWHAPMYWERHGDSWMIRDFSGIHTVDEKADEPVTHVSFFEASAFAKWAGKRLPTEAEWEVAARCGPSTKYLQSFPWGESSPTLERANLFENLLWGAAPVGSFPSGVSASGCYQMVGDVWEWTTSDYVGYPGFKTDFDEYNDKWFVGQKVLRGGSYATPQSHIRTTYRNFFHPNERWMICGFRCARDIE